MKALIPALLFSATIPALCQTTPQRPPNRNPPYPNQILQSPGQFPLSPLDSTKTKIFRFSGDPNDVPMGEVRVPLRTLAPTDPHIDDQIIHRPPQASFAQQEPYAPLAGNLYPGLELLPLNLSSTETARGEPIPAYFPKFKVEPIPTIWPNGKAIPVQAGQSSIIPKK
jgi:hypothetical protein